MSMKEDDKEAAEVAVAARVSLADIESSIAERYDFTAGQACKAIGIIASRAADVMSICILVMKNGYVVVGTSAPASPANFDSQLGKKFAYEQAIRQLWPLMGFSLRDKLAEEAALAAEEAGEEEEVEELVEYEEEEEEEKEEEEEE